LGRTKASGTVKLRVRRKRIFGTDKLDVYLEYYRMSVKDTYDFSYGNDTIVRQAAVVQSGFASDHGNSGIGQVFFTQIDIEETVDDFWARLVVTLTL